MSKLLKNKAFLFGFLFGIFIFLWGSFYEGWNEGFCSDVSVRIGFPISYSSSYCDGIFLDQVSVIVLTVDFLIAVICSFLIGLVFKFVWSKILARRLK